NSMKVDLSDIKPKVRLVGKEFQIFVNAGRYNLDGFVLPMGLDDGNKPVRGYIQIFRTGAIECVVPYSSKHIEELVLYDLELNYLKYLRDSLELMNRVGVELPIGIFLSLSNIERWHFTDTSQSLSDITNANRSYRNPTLL